MTQSRDPALETGALFRAHARELKRLALRLLAGCGDADDVLQETFLVVDRRLHELEDPAKASAWLRAITYRVAKAQRRKWIWRGRLSFWGDSPEVASSMSTPEAQVVARSQAALAERILASLSEHHRDVLVLFELEQLSGEEISELLGIRVSAVWVRLHRAREAFSKHHDRLTREARK